MPPDDALLILHPQDNVGVRRGAVQAGHRQALRAIEAGEPLRKAGCGIGTAAHDIPAGTVLAAADVVPGLDGAAAPRTALPVLPETERATFQGYVRADGRVGTRNTIGVFVVGNCGATAARQAADFFDAEQLAAFPNVDAVVPYVHEIGCGMEMTGEPMDLLRRTISGTIRNPNTFGAVVIALGCERNNLRGFLEQEKLAIGGRLHTITIQDIGGIRKAVEEAKRMIGAMLPDANLVRRSTVSARTLVLGLQSGAAAGFCGISSNPALGATVDLLIRNGGTVILSETPDLHGVTRRFADGASPAVAAALAERMQWWLDHSRGRDTRLNGRLSRQDEAAGFVGVLDKALDGSRKAGQSPVAEVRRYAERVHGPGLVFMDSPSYDPVSVTGQIAGGATLIAFTTGQGSCFGSQPAPTVKLVSDSATFARMQDDSDIDCGPVLNGTTSVAVMGKAIFARILAHASGERTRSEIDGLGENEFVPWPIGVLA